MEGTKEEDKILVLMRERFPYCPEEYLRLVLRITEICNTKNKAYGEGTLRAFEESTRFGIPAWKGCLLRLGDKWSRICSLVKQRDVGDSTDERIEDTLMDAANYALITIILLKRERDATPEIIH